eukprot:GILJ01016031.1.p1 GENE.GILJ01016031.1~~GILJ01016031.1.p1  ORF type:complete len:402 (+),score=60.07 GILJ01016031.1:115-1320(+)
MGIKGLAKLIGDIAPAALKEQTFASYTGRKLAIDASMSLYQFLIAVRSNVQGENYGMLTNEAGEVTSHIQGLFSRTIKMMENGIKPLFVFDGKPPALKVAQLAKRSTRKHEATAQLAAAEDQGHAEDIQKYASRVVTVTTQHVDEAKRLLTLMGVPIVQAPSEAEAQCSRLCMAGKVYGTASEDMDSLPFGTPKLVRHMTFADARKMPIVEIDLQTVLNDLGLDMRQFIDVCILSGCDYTDAIKGIGPMTAYKLIKTHGSIEAALHQLDKTKYIIPDNFDFEGARQLFLSPDVVSVQDLDLVWKQPDEAGLRQFLVVEKNFDPTRVESSLKKLRNAQSKASQSRLESFFGPTSVIKRKAPVQLVSSGKRAKPNTAGRSKSQAVAAATKTTTSSELGQQVQP